MPSSSNQPVVAYLGLDAKIADTPLSYTAPTLLADEAKFRDHASGLMVAEAGPASGAPMLFVAGPPMKGQTTPTSSTVYIRHGVRPKDMSIIKDKQAKSPHPAINSVVIPNIVATNAAEYLGVGKKDQHYKGLSSCGLHRLIANSAGSPSHLAITTTGEVYRHDTTGLSYLSEGIRRALAASSGPEWFDVWGRLQSITYNEGVAVFVCDSGGDTWVLIGDFTAINQQADVWSAHKLQTTRGKHPQVAGVSATGSPQTDVWVDADRGLVTIVSASITLALVNDTVTVANQPLRIALSVAKPTPLQAVHAAASSSLSIDVSIFSLHTAGRSFPQRQRHHSWQTGCFDRKLTSPEVLVSCQGRLLAIAVREAKPSGSTSPLVLQCRLPSAESLYVSITSAALLPFVISTSERNSERLVQLLHLGDGHVLLLDAALTVSAAQCLGCTLHMLDTGLPKDLHSSNPSPRLLPIGAANGMPRLLLCVAPFVVVLDLQMPSIEGGSHMDLIKVIRSSQTDTSDIQVAVEGLTRVLPQLRRIVATFIPSTASRPFTARTIKEATAIWERPSRLADPSQVAHQQRHGVFPLPLFYFQLLLGDLTAIQSLDDVASVVKGLRPVMAHLASAPEVDLEMLWPILRGLKEWQVTAAHPSMTDHITLAFAQLFQHYFENEEGSEEEPHRAEDHRPKPLTTYSRDPNEAFLILISQFAGALPFQGLMVGSSAAVGPQHPPIVATHQQADGTWVVEAQNGSIDVLYGLGMLLAASIAGIECGVYLTKPGPHPSFVVTVSDANPTEACIIVPPTPIEEGEAEQLQVLCCDVLASCCLTRHRHQALPVALLVSMASRRYHAASPVLETHLHGIIAKYSDTIDRTLASTNSLASIECRPLMDLTSAIADSSDDSIPPISGEELFTLCQFAMSCDSVELLEFILRLVPTPSLSLAASGSQALAGSFAGAVSYAMVMCNAMAQSAIDAFADEGTTVSSNLSYGLDRFKRFFSDQSTVGAITVGVSRLMSVAIVHRYTEFALAAMNNFSSEVQRKYLAKDEASYQCSLHQCDLLGARLEVALQRASSLLGFLSATVFNGQAVPEYHHGPYLQELERAVLSSVDANNTVIKSAITVPRQAGPADLVASTVLLDYHVLRVIQTTLDRLKSLRNSQISLAEGVAATLKGAGPALSIGKYMQAALDAFEIVLSAGDQPILPLEELQSLLLVSVGLAVTLLRFKGSTTPQSLGAMLVLQQMLAISDIEKATSNVSLHRQYHHLSSAINEATGMEMGIDERQPQEGEAARRAAMTGVPSVVMPGAQALPSQAGTAKTRPTADVLANAKAAASVWQSFLDTICCVYACDRKHSTSLLATTMGTGTLSTTINTLVSSAARWRADHCPESRRFLISQGWWQQVPADARAWVLAHKVIGHLPPTTAPILVPSAADLYPEPLTTPSLYSLSPRNNSGKQTHMLDQPLYSLVCTLVPPTRGFHKATADGYSIDAYQPIVASTPEPLRRSQVGALAVRESAMSMPSVCVSASTPSHSPNNFRDKPVDEVVRMSLGDESMLKITGPEAIESERYPIQSIAWWEEGPRIPEASMIPTETTTTTVTSAGSPPPNTAGPVDFVRLLLTEMLDKDDKEHRHKKCRRHRDRHASKAQSAAAQEPMDTFRSIAASGLKPPSSLMPPGASSEVPLLTLGRSTGPSVRLFTTTDDGEAVPLTNPSGNMAAGIPSPYVTQPPMPMPPLGLGIPGAVPTRAAMVPPLSYGGSMPLPQLPQGFSIVAYGNSGTKADEAAPTVYLKMPPPPAHYTRPLAAPRADLVDSPGGSEPRSEGITIINLEEAMKAEERLKRKASKKAAKANSKVASDSAEKDKDKKTKRDRTATNSPLLPPLSAVVAAPLPPSLDTKPIPLSVGSITALPPDTHPLGLTEQIQFKRYVDDLLARNPESKPIPAPVSLPPGFSALPTTPSHRKSETDHEGFMQQLLTRQQAMFEVNQEALNRNQQDNTKLLRDILAEKQQSGTVHTTTIVTPSPIAAGPLGLSAIQQSQLLQQTMDQRDKLMRMNDDVLRLQAQNIALAKAPQYIPSGTQVTYVPVQAPQRASTASIAVGDSIVNVVQTSHGIDSGAQCSPLRMETAAVNTSQPFALSAGVQADLATPAPTPSAIPATVPLSSNIATVDTLRATMMQLGLLTEQLSKATSQSEDMHKALSDSRQALANYQHLASAGALASEQVAAIEALRSKAGFLESQLSYLGSMPRDMAPAGAPVRGPSVTNWDSPTHARTTVPPLVSIPTVNPLRHSQLGTAQLPEAVLAHSPPRELAPRYPDATTPIRSIIKDSTAVGTSYAPTPSQLSARKVSEVASSAIKPFAATFADTSVRKSVQKSVTIEEEAPAIPLVMQGAWQVLGTGQPQPAYTFHAANGPSHALRAKTPSSHRPAQVTSLGDLIADAKASARKAQQKERPAPSQPKRPASSHSYKLANGGYSESFAERYAMYLQPAKQPARVPSPATKEHASFYSGPVLGVVDPNISINAGWELRGNKRFEYGDAIAVRQKSLLEDHTAMRIMGLKDLLS